MLLSEIRDRLVELSGRSDLTSNTALADWHINAGQRMLDRMQPTRRGWKPHTTTLAAGSYYVDLENIIDIADIYVDGEDEPLSFVSTLRELMEDYPNLGDTDVGDVSVWTYWHATGTTESAEGKVRILCLPPASADTDLVIHGTFYSTELTGNNSFSYWSAQHPEVLIAAAMFNIETFHRNSEGARDWMNFIGVRLDGVDKHLAMMEDSGARYLGG